jgi:hypothetical protein
MKKIYKIFGAVAIIGLFVLGSMSTGMANERVAFGERKVVESEPIASEPIELELEGEPAYADFDDDQYPIGYPGESLDYCPETTPIFFKNGDLATTIVWRRPTVLTDARIRVKVRNVGAGQSGGGTMAFTLYTCVLGIPQMLQPTYVSDTRTVSPLKEDESEVHVFPSLLPGAGIDMSGNLYYFRNNINPYKYEGPIRHHSVRHGWLVGIQL